MVVRKRKKTRKLRGRTRSMGWGRIGQHRKSGSKGGFGAAGLGKHKWSWTSKYAPTWFGKHGFNRPSKLQKHPVAINLYEVVERLEDWKNKGLVKEENGKMVIDLQMLGYTKLLGTGKINVPLKIIVKEASEKAIEKIKNVGGTVELIEQQ